jgi:flagella basal body P-ring formation protein FlgA
VKSAFSIWILFGVTLVFGVWVVPARAETVSTAISLQTELRKQYPEVETWIIKPVSAIRVKRALQLFAQPVTGTIIYRDTNLFVLRTNDAAAQHYIVKANQRVLTVAAFARRGSSLQSAEAVFELRDVFATSCDSIAEGFRSVNFKDWRLRRDVHANEAICRNDIEPVPLVSKHETLALNCTQGEVTVTAIVQALDDGWLGKTIKVRRESNHAVVMARITGRGEVDACI